MSVWTHVDGNIRIDVLDGDRKKGEAERWFRKLKADLEDFLGQSNDTFNSRSFWGSEEPIYYTISPRYIADKYVLRDEFHRLEQINIGLYGDLRDVDDKCLDYYTKKHLDKWFEDLLKGLNEKYLVRSATLGVLCDLLDSEPYALVWDWSSEFNERVMKKLTYNTKGIK